MPACSRPPPWSRRARRSLRRSNPASAELEAQEKVLRVSLAERYDHIAKLLAALQRMGRNPPPVMITQREDALKMVRSAMLLATAFPEMHGQAIELNEQGSNELVRVMDDIRSEGEQAAKPRPPRLNDMRTRLSGLLETKKQCLSERESELKNVRKAAAEIAKSVNDLNELIAQARPGGQGKAASSAPSRRKATARRRHRPAAPGAAPRRRRLCGRTARSRAPSPRRCAALGPVPTPGAPSSIVELAPGVSLVPGSPGRIKPAIAFNVAKGKLPDARAGPPGPVLRRKDAIWGAIEGTCASKRVMAPKSRHLVTAGLFTLVNFAATANS